MSVAARKLADDALRCPKCGKKVVNSLCCGHCGSRISIEQGDLYHAAAKQLRLLNMGGNPARDATYRSGSSSTPSPRIFPISPGDDSDDTDGWSESPPTPSVNHERYTPPALISLVHKAFGQIDLDPASSKEANKVVKAKSFFTKKTNGLKQRWRGRIFLNPPFDDWPTWVAKLDEEIQARRVKQAIVVGPANISAFRLLLKRKGLLFVPNERPKYYDPNSEELIDPPFGSLLCYVGSSQSRFVSAFREQGIVLRVV